MEPELVSWEQIEFESEALRGNPLGDPSSRPLYVWSPEDLSRRYPSVYVIQGLTGMVRAWFNVSPFQRNLPDEIDALGLDAIVVLVDGWSALGGSQWIDSAGIGRYGTYLCEDVAEPGSPIGSVRGDQA